MRVVRADGDTLVNANSAAIQNLKIENEEDFDTNHESDTTWEFAAKTPGRWGNNLKVCTIDAFADQILTGIGTTAKSVSTTTTVATKTGNIGITTTIITGITTTLVSVGNVVVNSNVPVGTNIDSIGVGEIVLDTATTNTGSLTGESFNFTNTSTSLQATDVQVGYAVTQAVNAQFASQGTVTSFNGFIRGIITGIGEDEIYVKITDRVSDDTGTVEAIEYKNPGASKNTYSFSGDEILNVVTPAGITTTTAETNQLNSKDWYDNQKLGISNSEIFWKSIASKPGTSQYAADRSGKNDQIHVVVVDDTGGISGTASNILEKHTFLSKASDAKISPTQDIYYKRYISNGSANVYAGFPIPGPSTGLVSSLVGDKTGFTADNGVWEVKHSQQHLLQQVMLLTHYLRVKITTVQVE